LSFYVNMFSRTCNTDPNETCVAYSRVIGRKHVEGVPPPEDGQLTLVQPQILLDELLAYWSAL
jgi:hypothetical protein